MAGCTSGRSGGGGGGGGSDEPITDAICNEVYEFLPGHWEYDHPAAPEPQFVFVAEPPAEAGGLDIWWAHHEDSQRFSSWGQEAMPCTLESSSNRLTFVGMTSNSVDVVNGPPESGLDPVTWFPSDSDSWGAARD